jgi:hypothetical protein
MTQGYVGHSGRNSTKRLEMSTEEHTLLDTWLDHVRDEIERLERENRERFRCEQMFWANEERLSKLREELWLSELSEELYREED